MLVLNPVFEHGLGCLGRIDQWIKGVTCEKWYVVFIEKNVAGLYSIESLFFAKELMVLYLPKDSSHRVMH